MRLVLRLLIVAGLAGLVPLGSALPAVAAAVVTSGTGANASALQPTVDAFRAALGSLNPNVASSFASGRREINWDGVPDNRSAPNNFPADFFNVTSPRGAVFSTPGSAMQVSANAGAAPARFGTINASYPGAFGTFSPQRLFTAIGGNVIDVGFFLPGTSVPATVRSFGAVFTDVDGPGSSLQFFDAAGVSLGAFAVPARAGSETLSFLGVSLDAGQGAARVRITSGNTPLDPAIADGGATDLVVLDDFIYAEPQANSAAICDNPPAPGTPLAGYNVIVSQPGALTVGTDGRDLIYGSAGDDQIAGRGGNDIILGMGGSDQLSGDGGNDTLCGGDGADQLNGGAGDDTIFGQAGDDDLAGGPGADLLSGGDGADRCTAGGNPGDSSAPPPSCNLIT